MKRQLISKLWVCTFLTAIAGSTIPTKAAEICNSITCHNEAERIIKSLDTSVQPCDNFLRFVCGKYEKPEELLDNVNPLDRVDVKALLKKGISNSRPEQFVADLYKTCMNPDSLGKQAEDLMRLHVNTLLKSLTFKENGLDGTFDWIRFTSEAKRIGYSTNFFLDFKPTPTYHRNNTLRYSIQMAPTYFDLLMNSTNTSLRDLYVQYMSNVTRAIGEEVSGAKLKKMFHFESKLAEITAPESRFYTKDISVEDLQKQWPSIDWKRLIDQVLMPFVDSDEKPTFTVWDEKALTEFAKLMEKTPGTVLAQYAIWKVQQYSVPFLTEQVREVRKVFLRQIGHPEKPRDVICLEAVKKYAGYVVEHMYLNYHRSSVRVIKNMTESIKQELIKMMEESKMLSKEDKKKGVDILEAKPVIFGSSSLSLDSKELDRFYAEAKVFKGNYFRTILGLNVFISRKEYSSLVHRRFIKYPVTVHFPGLPSNWGKDLYIPVDMIPSTSFEVDRPMYQNFGAAGTFIAHEIVESLLHLGRHWHDNGTEFGNDQSDCFQNSMKKISDPSLIKAIRRYGEEEFIEYHIAFRAVYAAYQNSVHKLNGEPKLPQLPYSQEQMFWISFLQPFCFVNMEPNQQRMYGSSKFTMGEYMVTGIFANVQQMSIDFQCPLGSEINPEHKCSWW